MTLGSIEAGTLVACTSIFTLIISKIKCYYKRPTCLCGFIDTNIVDDSDINMNITTVNDVQLLYVSKKSVQLDDNSDDNNNNANLCFCSSPFNIF